MLLQSPPCGDPSPRHPPEPLSPPRPSPPTLAAGESFSCVRSTSYRGSSTRVTCFRFRG
jgi:hypothetical protein